MASMDEASAKNDAVKALLESQTATWQKVSDIMVEATQFKQAQVESLAGELARLKACSGRKKRCRNSPGDEACIECWSILSEQRAEDADKKRKAEAEARRWASECARAGMSIEWEDLPPEGGDAVKAKRVAVFMPMGDTATSMPFSIWADGEAPAGWVRDTAHGPFETFWCKGRKLLVASSLDTDEDGNDWLHVSLSLPNKLPSWQDVKMVKRLFFGAEETAWQCIAPDSQWVNLHRNCLHLWALWPFPGAQAEESGKEAGADAV